MDTELSLLAGAIESLDRVKSDSKAGVLVDQLSKLFVDSPNEKVLVFTQFRETLRFLEEMLTSKSWGVNVFHGQMRPMDKDRAVEDFRIEDGPQILISTEAGGEGRNFQFCHVLVNYDLPWNPMKVEQRIGRVDTEIGHSLVRRAFHFDEDEREIEASSIPDNLDAIAPIANHIADDRRAELQEQAEGQAAARIERELSRLGEWFDYREKVAKDRIEATRATRNRIQESGDESQMQILPVWEANLRRDEELLANLAPERSRRLADVEKHRFPQVSWALKAYGRIEVVDLEPTDGPDAGLELREDFFAELQASLEAIGDGGSAHSAEEVAQRLGLT